MSRDRCARRPSLVSGRTFGSIDFLLPFSGLLRLSPVLIELNDPFAGAIQVIPIRDSNVIFSFCHPLITFDQQVFRFDVFLLPSQAGAQQTLGAESLPVIRLLPSIKLQRLAREGLTFGELPL